MRMNSYPSPCDSCPHDGRKSCKGTRCEPWRIRYLYRQKQINAYARKIGAMGPKRSVNGENTSAN